MRRKTVLLTIFMFINSFIFINSTTAGSKRINVNLKKAINFKAERSSDIQYFTMESKVINYGLDGIREGLTTYRLLLKVMPSEKSGKSGDEYTCLRFTIQSNEFEEVEVPALKNWTHYFDEAGIDSKGQVFGINHSKFENLYDDKGNELDISTKYIVYNVFIDFHGICFLFAQPTTEGNGIQHLSKIGDKIVHAAAFTQAPTNLGSIIKEGSFFQNGEITLELKGISLLNNKPCSLIEYDSGKSSFIMLMQPAPGFEIKTKGSSHYYGDIYKNLKTNWVQKVILKEFVVSETIIPAPVSSTKNSITEREIVIQNITKENMSEILNTLKGNKP